MVFGNCVVNICVFVSVEWLVVYLSKGKIYRHNLYLVLRYFLH